MEEGRGGKEMINWRKMIDALWKRIWVELKKLWAVAGPAVFTRFSMFGVFVIAQAFIGRIGDVHMAAVALVFHVFVCFSIGILMGMSSGLETLCGQAFGAKQYHMLGIYLQRSWLVEAVFCLLLLPFFVFAAPILKLLGQSSKIAAEANIMSIWYIPTIVSYIFSFTLQMYLQSQSKNMIITWLAAVSLVVHALLCWVLTKLFAAGVAGVMLSMIVASWVPILGQLVYIFNGGCPRTWTGFSILAFTDVIPVVKLSLSSGVMLWYALSVLIYICNGTDLPIYRFTGRSKLYKT